MTVLERLCILDMFEAQERMHGNVKYTTTENVCYIEEKHAFQVSIIG